MATRGRGKGRGGFSNRREESQSRTGGSIVEDRVFNQDTESVIKPSQQPDPPKSDNRKQRNESIQDIKKFESKKKNDPSFKGITLNEFFTEWIDLERNNITAELDDFEVPMLHEMRRVLTSTTDIRKIVDKDERKEVLDSFDGGMVLSIALRLLITTSNTQRSKDYEMFRLTEEISAMEVPRVWNSVISNLGKFSDEVFGNFRIQSPIWHAKTYVLKACQKVKDHMELRFKGGTSDERKKQVSELISGFDYDKELIMFGDDDSISYVKHYARNKFLKARDKVFKVTLDNGKEIHLSLPAYDFSKVSKKKMKEAVLSYLGYISHIDNKVSSDAEKIRNEAACYLILQLADEEMFFNLDQKIGKWNKALNSISWVKDASISELLRMGGIYYVGDCLDTSTVIRNARTVFELYNTNAIPYLRKIMVLTDLVRGEFGTQAQLIEADVDEDEDLQNTSFKAVTKLKDNNLNVFGALYGFAKNIKFKRNLNSHLSASRRNIRQSLIDKDIKRR